MAELLPNFYKVTHSEHINETDWVVQVMLNPQHAIYNGHFPQQPVVPGVCMLQMIKECIEKIQQAPLQYKQIASCKFLSVINPNETPECDYNRVPLSYILQKAAVYAGNRYVDHTH